MPPKREQLLRGTQIMFTDPGVPERPSPEPCPVPHRIVLWHLANSDSILIVREDFFISVVWGRDLGPGGLDGYKDEVVAHVQLQAANGQCH